MPFFIQLLVKSSRGAIPFRNMTLKYLLEKEMSNEMSYFDHFWWGHNIKSNSRLLSFYGMVTFLLFFMFISTILICHPCDKWEQPCFFTEKEKNDDEFSIKEDSDDEIYMDEPDCIVIDKYDFTSS